MNYAIEDGVITSGDVKWSGGTFRVMRIDRPGENKVNYVNENGTSMFVIWRGLAEVRNRKVDGVSLPLENDHASIISAGSELTANYSFKGQGLHFTFSDEFISESCGAVRTHLLDNTVFPSNLDMLARSVGDELISHISEAEVVDQLLVEGATTYLTARFLQQFQRNSSRGKIELSKEKLGRILDFIEVEMHRNIGLEELSNLAGLSTSHFCLAFRASTRTSPHQYVLNRKVEAAKVILKATRNEANIADLALQLGFNSQSHFTRAFRLTTGTTPAKYSREIY